MGSIGIFTTDRNLKIKTWDEWLEGATGIKKSEVKDKPLDTVAPDLDKKHLRKRFQNVLENGVVEVLSPLFHRHLIPCKPLKPSVFYETMQQRVTIAPLRENEEIVGTIVTVEDMTERLEKERLISEKLKSKNEVERLSAVRYLIQEESIEDKSIIKEVLKDESWRVRKVAVDALRSRTDFNTVGSLLKALKEEHKNINILNSALQILTMSELEVTEALIDFLSSEDNELRQYAALSLGEIRDKKAVPYLIKALNDEDINVRYHAVEALGKIKAEDAVEPLLEILETKDFFLTFPAIDALVSIGDERVVPRLVHLLDDEMFAGPAVDAIGVLGNEDVIPHLFSLMDRTDTNISSILKAIAAIYERYNEQYGEGEVIADTVKRSISKTVAEKIIGLLDSAPDDLLHIIAMILGWLEGEEIGRALTGILGKTSARKEIIDSIVKHGQKVVNLLIDMAYSEDREIRKSAIIALGRIGDRRALPVLISVLDDDPELAILSAGALAKIGDRDAYEALIGHIGEKDIGVRQAVISALNSIGHPDMSKRMLTPLKDEDPIVRESAVRIAGYFGYEECIDLLLERCKDEAENVRYAAIQCLPFLEDKRALDVIAYAIEKDTPKVRGAAASALGQIEEKGAFIYLKKALSDPDPWVRYFAARAAGERGDPEVLDILVEMIDKDNAEQVRISAIEAIGKIGSEKAVEVLKRFIENENIDIARTTVVALGKITHPEALNLLLSTVHSRDRLIKMETIRALGLRGGVEAVNILKRIASSEGNEEVAEMAIESLSQIGSRDAISALLQLTSFKNRRNLCISKLSQLMGRYIEWIAEGLNNPNPHVRSSTIDILARMKHPDATEAIVSALDDADGEVRLSAVNALGYLGSRFGEKQLSKVALYDSDETVRNAARKVLMRVKGSGILQ
ncbi:MAG: HEAT repeat domain-containing protein [Syntrophorhabdaceae bacterium]|nr:HEAT repeat domain-containing protein [Syntrophorhabdaceae bacterium]